MAPAVAEISELKTKLELVQGQLAYLEDLKRKEASLRKEEADLVSRLEELQVAVEFYNGQDADDGWDTVPVKTHKSTKQALQFSSPAVQSLMKPAVEDHRKKRIKAINKKLEAIAKLKEKGEANLDEEQMAKVRSEAKLEREKAALVAGQDFDSEADSDEGEDEGRRALPADAGERDKRIKVVQKKLSQIAELKKKQTSALDAAAKQKIAGEVKLRQELSALESGAAEVVFDATEEKLEEKIEQEKKLKAVKKKLAQIASLKENKQPSEYTEEEKVKMASEKGLKKEQSELEHKISALNKEERERVADRLGWEVETGKKKKNNKK